MLTSARLTLKLHRFEVGAAALAAILVGAAALLVDYRLRAVGVPAGCFDAWLNGGGAAGAGSCAAPVEAFATINEQDAGRVFAAMAVLPFAVGLLAGVPLVGRELESRTAQTAWYLDGSRLRWLARQFVPVALLLLVLVAFAALAADVLEETREPWYHSTFADMTLHGPIVIGRAAAALGLGLLAGAVIGRSLPAFVVGALASVLVLTAVGNAHDAWLRDQPTAVIEFTEVGTMRTPAEVTGTAWRSPIGELISADAAEALVPTVSVQPGHPPDEWLIEHGYQQVELGITAAQALGWVPIDIAAFTAVGLLALVGSALVVDRRRPS